MQGRIEKCCELAEFVVPVVAPFNDPRCIVYLRIILDILFVWIQRDNVGAWRSGKFAILLREQRISGSRYILLAC
jgi:hypothetical protein